MKQTSAASLNRWIPARVRKLHPYVPGEQPKIKGLIKLNTNENPYPPSPGVFEAIRKALDGRLRLYPNPTAQKLRERLARVHRCSPENVIVGNGSDDLLALATRAFVEPAGGRSGRNSASTVQFFTPSYSLYPVLANIHGATINAVPLEKDFRLPPLSSLRTSGSWDFRAALSFITTPNAPSGRAYATAELSRLCAAQRGIVLLDEAYVNFARENAMALAQRFSHVLVARTFSKAYSLCFMRVGYCIGHPTLIAALDKVRDSYNVNGLGQIAAEAALNDAAFYRAQFKTIIATRERLATALKALGFEVLPSQTNFLLAKPPGPPAKAWLQALRERKILVRWFAAPEIRDFLRITVGTDAEADALLRAARALVR